MKCAIFNKHGRTQCTAHHVKEDALIEIITKDIRTIFSSFKSDSFRTEMTSRVTKLSEKDLKQDKINALRAKVRKEIENDEYQLLVDDCNFKISKLNEEKILLQETLNKKQNELDFNELHKKLEEFMKNPTLDRKILHKLIERIEILEDGSPRIYYRFSNSYMSSIFLRATNSTQRATIGVD